MSEIAATTKQCPFCAETIQVAAIVCRYCGRDLVEKPTAPVVQAQTDDRTLLQQEVARLTSQGWQVVSQTDTTVQIKKPKTWSPFLLAAALVCLLCFAVFGMVMIYLAIGLLVLAAIDYAAKKEPLRFISADQLKQSTALIDPNAPARRIVGEQPGTWRCSRCGRQLHPQAEGCAFCKQKFA
jgi:hypothetical protein